MRIAIIGAGFFGLTVGLFLSKKHKVEIFEKNSSIMQGASFGNQLRFHHGYHYPRSQKTVSEISKSKDLFYKRMDKHISDNLFTTKFAINHAKDFCEKEKNNILVYENLIEDKN